jgi:hypothetical protein
MSKHVFISYPEKDRKLAEKLMRALQAEGISTIWVDKVIEPGTNWQQRLEAAIESAQAIVVLVDSKHESGRQQRFEWTMALEAKWKNPDKQLIPLLFRNAEPPSFLADKQAIRVNDLSKDWDQAVETLIRILKDEQIEPEQLVSVKLADYSEWLDRLKYIEDQAEVLKQSELDKRF